MQGIKRRVVEVCRIHRVGQVRVRPVPYRRVVGEHHAVEVVDVERLQRGQPERPHRRSARLEHGFLRQRGDRPRPARKVLATAGVGLVGVQRARLAEHDFGAGKAAAGHDHAVHLDGHRRAHLVAVCRAAAEVARPVDPDDGIVGPFRKPLQYRLIALHAALQHVETLQHPCVEIDLRARLRAPPPAHHSPALHGLEDVDRAVPDVARDLAARRQLGQLLNTVQRVLVHRPAIALEKARQRIDLRRCPVAFRRRMARRAIRDP